MAKFPELLVSRNACSIMLCTSLMMSLPDTLNKQSVNKNVTLQFTMQMQAMCVFILVSLAYHYGRLCLCLQNVRPEKLFTKERAVRQLLEIIDGTTNQSNGRFYAWDKQEIPW